MEKGKLLVVGFGPGSFEHITKRAKEALQESDCIIGYTTYMELIKDLLTEDQEIVQTGMTEEVSRAQEAVRLAETGKKVAVISSGDAGVYGMAGLIYEVLIEKGWKEKDGVEVEVIPGISAINSCASLVGAPVMHDACTISLSDHLTPWEIIERRLEAAASADFVVALYNPKSGRRTKQIQEAQAIFLKYRKKETPVALVKSAYRDRQQVVITNLEEMLEHDIGMLTTVIIGNSATFLYDGKLITPRGYQRKYTLDSEKQSLRPHQRLKAENEPWALHQGEEIEETSTQATSLDLANEALTLVTGEKSESSPFKQESIFEFAVSPGVANKKMTSEQLMTLSKIVGDNGSLEYSTDHQLVVRIPCEDPSVITTQIQEAGLLLAPIGDVITVKACDFCDGDKEGGIPYANEIYENFNGMKVPKELKIGFNGCGMACYGAVKEDIGIVYRRQKFDLFLGAKTVGRTAHSGVPVAEEMPPEMLVPTLTKIIEAYIEEGHPNERFFKYFKRVGNVAGFKHVEMPTPKLEPLLCGDE
ncbi:precorrin-3B C(17)-methyltransferase [Massilibacterium senegalense]|uniref:precorrin-3B C(17)-methyltransferase n=1 Tax=Massilibacterium senegalense TaxID=1632858 RepID=UPI0007822B07|nr:precorrin-3B C(17)-methyltransferase [Massilibacterium senegalense]